MNKNIFLVLAIIFIVIVLMGTAAYSWNQQNMNRQTEETIGWLKNPVEFSGWLTSSAWTDWIESGGIQEISDGNCQADSRIILLTRW